jgi:hypothetical protein
MLSVAASVALPVLIVVACVLVARDNREPLVWDRGEVSAVCLVRGHSWFSLVSFSRACRLGCCTRLHARRLACVRCGREVTRTEGPLLVTCINWRDEDPRPPYRSPLSPASLLLPPDPPKSEDP